MLTLTQNELMIVGKYFDTIQDYINLTKTCKTYENILNLYKTNFIPILTKSQVDLFPNLQTYNLYTNQDFKSTSLKTISYVSTPLSKVKQNENENIIYKNIILDYLQFKLNTNICSISDNCFEDCKILNDIILPYSITKIGNKCFYRCKNLIKVDLSMCIELKELSDECFCCCNSLSNIKLPTSIVSLGSDSFYKCTSLINVNLSMCTNLKNFQIHVLKVVKNLKI